MGKPNAAESARMAAVAKLPCAVCGTVWDVTVHHCGTYMGGGRDHMRTIPLCWDHHLGAERIDGKRMGKRVWEARYGTEESLLAQTNLLLGMP